MFCGEVILNSNNCLKDVNSDSESNSDNELQTNVSNLKLDNEELIFNPYNSNNLEITSANVQELLSKYGIFTKPFNLELYKRAFIHKSYTKRPKLENSIANIIIATVDQIIILLTISDASPFSSRVSRNAGTILFIIIIH